MKLKSDRRKFLKAATVAGIGLTMKGSLMNAFGNAGRVKEIRIGIIGLDTEHSVAFTKVFNDPHAAADVAGFKVVAAYPYGSKDIDFSIKAIPKFTAEMTALGVPIVNSIDELLTRVDVVLLETNDGRLHLEQALPVIKAGKPVFIDKPIAASLKDAILIFKAAEKYNVPVFSASSLRYMNSVQDIANGKAGKILGADTYGPATIEKTHPDLFWYGVHGVEALFTVMGTGCKSVKRYYSDGWDMVVGTWDDNRIGTFRGIRSGKTDFGGNAFGERAIAPIGPWSGYRVLVVQIAQFFRTGKSPVSPKETLEIFAFMEAAEKSKQEAGAIVTLAQVMEEA